MMGKETSDFLDGLDDVKKVLQVSLGIIGLVSSLASLWLYFSEKAEREKR